MADEPGCAQKFLLETAAKFRTKRRDAASPYIVCQQRRADATPGLVWAQRTVYIGMSSPFYYWYFAILYC